MAIDNKGIVFDIQGYCLHDGPGIRTLVFLKGCPLRCKWCCNPESVELSPTLFYLHDLCTRCYQCVEACSNKANRVTEDGLVEIDRTLCQACGKCVEACLGGARYISGKQMDVAEVVEQVKKDTVFYRVSRGGVTFSGGEPLQQGDFLVALAEGCSRAGFHTAMETSVYGLWDTLERVAKHLDLVMCDIKHMDPEVHKSLTGVDNQLILENIRRLASTGIDMVIRVPLITGLNDSCENISELGRYVADIGCYRVDLLPYHKYGIGKYPRVGKQYPLSESEPPPKEVVESVKDCLEHFGLKVRIEGNDE